MTFTLTIMGNIGSGKSTLINHLCSDRFNIIQEPVHLWTDWLNCFYSNPTKFSFPFQMKVLLDFVSLINYEKFSSNKFTIVERSPLESLQIFAQTLVDKGQMNLMEFNLLCDYHNQFAWKPDAIIYLDCDPTTCLERIQIRNRDSENNIELSYLEHLNTHYTNFCNIKQDIPIYKIDANRDENNVQSQLSDIISLLDSVFSKKFN